jgi:hypothetical protein
VLKLECFRKQIRNTLKVLKCGLEKMILIDHVKNDEVLSRIKEEINILHRIKERKANWIGHICLMNTLLKERQKR